MKKNRAVVSKTKVVKKVRKSAVPPAGAQPMTLARAFSERGAVVEPARDGTTMEIKKVPAQRRRISA